MRYVQIDFYYHCGDPHNWLAGSESSIQCVEANEDVEKAMDSLGIEWRHAYTFPDGSLYKYARTEMSDAELQLKLDAVLSGKNIRVNGIYVYADPEDVNPHKFNERGPVRSLKELFE